LALRGHDLELGSIHEMLFDGAQIHGPLDGGFMFCGESFGGKDVEKFIASNDCKIKVIFGATGPT
jgi:hypothetical protein